MALEKIVGLDGKSPGFKALGSPRHYPGSFAVGQLDLERRCDFTRDLIL
jgi:hypothetical protein